MKEIAMSKSETGRATIGFCGEGQDLELIQADGTREPIEANPESLRDAYQTVWAWYGSNPDWDLELLGEYERFFD